MLVALLVLLALVAGALAFVAQPIFLRRVRDGIPGADADRLRRDVTKLVRDFAPRDAAHPDVLARAASWLAEELRATGARVEGREFAAGRQTFRNVVGSFGPVDGPRVVVGAHYDVFGGMPGADDNASGVAGVLEVARLLAAAPPAGRVDLALWPNEEPPFFGGPQMGSAVHAEDLSRAAVPVRAMLSLEMIGYYRDEPGSQKFPLPGLSLLYGSRGNFLVLAGRLADVRLVRRVKAAMRGATDLPVKSLNAPPELAATDLSDNRCFWAKGIPALLVTDGAFFRNVNYHTPEDVPESLDYARMAGAVTAIAEAARALAR